MKCWRSTAVARLLRDWRVAAAVSRACRASVVMDSSAGTVSGLSSGAAIDASMVRARPRTGSCSLRSRVRYPTISPTALGWPDRPAQATSDSYATARSSAVGRRAAVTNPSRASPHGRNAVWCSVSASVARTSARPSTRCTSSCRRTRGSTVRISSDG